MMRKSSIITKLTASALLLGSLASPLNTSVKAETTASPNAVKLRILETTDLHANVMAYDYFADKPVDNFGLAKTATLIQQARGEVGESNSMLFDSGDTLQGNPLADYVAKVKTLGQDEVHPVYGAMNLLNYDAASLGNHEFNYGLEFLENAKEEAGFPYVNANVYVDDHDEDPTNDKNMFTPYEIIEKKVKDESGNEQTIKVGVIGFVPPQIMAWDKVNLEGKAIAKDIVKTANEFIPKMKADGADLIVALAHSGCDITSAGQEEAENAVFDLTKVQGLDAVLFGHKHVSFPGAKEFNDKEGIDNVKGTINGKPALEAGYWGNNLGVMDLTLEKVDGKWKVTDSTAVNRPVTKEVASDSSIEKIVEAAHNGTLSYVRGKIGETNAPMYSYFARVQDDPTIQIVNNAQIDYVKKYIDAKLPEYKDTPILSAGAPFRAGRQGPADFTNIAKGDLSIKSANDLYLYPNTLKAVEITGAEVKEWLEMSAGQFKQINPASKDPQMMIDYAFEPFNFDVIDGVKYEIDITQPAKYDLNGKLTNPDANRIKKLTMPDGTPVQADKKYIVVTNNYRASGGGNFPGTVGGKAKLVVDSADENRQVVMDYIATQGTINPSADSNWKISDIKGVTLTFKSSPDAQPIAKTTSHIQYLEPLTDDKGTWSLYSFATGDKVAPAKPVVNKVDDNDKKVTGKAEAASKITVKVGSKKVGYGTTDKYGKFSVTIKAQKAGTKLSLTATDKAGNVSKSTTVTVADKTAPKTPSIYIFKSKPTSLVGKGEVGSKVYAKVGTKVVGSATVSKKGTFTIKIKKQKSGTNVYIYSKDKAGNVSSSTKLSL